MLNEMQTFSFSFQKFEMKTNVASKIKCNVTSVSPFHLETKFPLLVYQQVVTLTVIFAVVTSRIRFY